VADKERTNRIYSRAYELAASGLHLEPITIISALIREGYPKAAEILGNPLVRDDLRQVCIRNWPGVRVIIGDDRTEKDRPPGRMPAKYLDHPDKP
jgi:hypothetical protein